jgi:hypothetical protein
MAAKIVDTILPTTMVGSYPRPHWFKHQLLGRDVRVAFKEVQHEEAYEDAVATVIRDQVEAGLDIVTDGNMWYDDYVGVIGSFCWYMYERIGGFEHAREQHPSTVGAAERNTGGDPLDCLGAIAQNIHENLVELRGIALHLWNGAEIFDHLNAIFQFTSQQLQCVLQTLMKIHSLKLRLLQPREIS